MGSFEDEFSHEFQLFHLFLFLLGDFRVFSPGQSAFQVPHSLAEGFPLRRFHLPGNMKGPYAPAYSIGGAGRLSLSLDLVPGPATYNTDSDTKRAAPRPVIGKSQRYGLATSRTGPGPGQYDTPSNIGKGRKALLFARNQPEIDRSRSPGPADYSPSDLTANCSYSVGRSKRHRTLSQQDVCPGPGSYDPKPINKASPRAM